MKSVHLARGLTLPAAELATKVIGNFGIRGSGKSNTMSLIIEQLLDAKIQVIVLDPVGIHFSIRLAADGKHSSPYQIPVLGGPHGDLGLEPTTGAVVGRALALSNDSCVLDISRMSRRARIQFSAAFAESFFESKKENPAPTLIALEEAQFFMPQQIFKGEGQERMLGAFEELGEQGRNHGAGLLANTLRPQALNKVITSLMDLVMSYRLTDVAARKRVQEWVQEKSAEGRDEIDNELPSLTTGNAFVWAPAAFEKPIFGKYHFDKKTTYDAGATPLYARAKVKIRPLDLAELEAAMGQVVADAKANDPRVLRTKIAELEKKLAGAVRGASISTGADSRNSKTARAERSETTKLLARVEKLVDKLDKQQKKFVHDFEQGAAAVHMFVKSFDQQRDRLAQAQQAVVSEVGSLKTMMGAVAHRSGSPLIDSGHVKKYIEGVPDTGISYTGAASRARSAGAAEAIRGNGVGRRHSDGTSFIDPGRGERQARVTGAATTSSSTSAVSAETDLPQYALDLLNVVAQRGRASDAQISTLARYSRRSSAFPKMLGKLTAAGLIEGSPDERRITEAGRKRAGTVEALPTGRALLDHWLVKLTGYEALFLRTIYNARTIGRDALSAETNRSRSSSAFEKTIGALRRLDLVDAPRGVDDVSISSSFFD